MTGLHALMLQAVPDAAAARATIIAVAVAYFAAVAAIAVWAARRTRTAADFFVAGRRIGVGALALAAMSATVSGFAFIGGPGLVYSSGMGALFLVLPAGITGTMTAWILARRLRLLGAARGLLTIPDAIGARYRSPAAQGLSAVAILVAVVGYMATNVLALGVVIDAIFGVGLGWGIWIGTGITLAYSVTGGILAGVYADVFQGTLMAIASMLVFAFALDAGGGLAAMSRTIAAVDTQFVEPFGRMSPLAALSLFFVFGLGALAQPHVAHKFYMLREVRLLRWYPALMTGALLLTLLLFFSVGYTVKALVAGGTLPPLGAPDEATPTLLLVATPAWLAALVFSGVAAAIMSTVNSFLSIGAAAVTHDLPVATGRPVHDELRAGRLATLAIAVLAGLVAQFSGSIVAFLGIFGWGLFASTLVPALAIGLAWPGATRAGAIASIATGLVMTLGLESLIYFDVFDAPAGVTVSGITLVLSLLVFLGVSWLTRHSAAATLDADVRMLMDAGPDLP